MSVLIGFTKPVVDGFEMAKSRLQLSTGISMAYIDAGNPKGEVILLLHGYTDTSRSFKKVIDQIVDQDTSLRILAPDLRGHGSTSVPENQSYEIGDFRNDILSLLAKLDIDKVHLVGHSMGSIIAQDFALARPDKVEDVILIGTFTCTDKNPVVQQFLSESMLYGEWKQILEEKANDHWSSQLDKLTPSDLGDSVADFLKQYWVTEARADQNFLNEIYTETVNTPLITWYKSLEMLSNVDHSDRLSDIDRPVMVIWGGDDAIFQEHPDQDLVKATLSKAQSKSSVPVFFKTYKRAGKDDLEVGHNLHWGLPKHVADDIVSFFQNGQPSLSNLDASVTSDLDLLAN
ncbi:alpha/beta fold hydrolase [Fulvivirga ligni]|uniref:alpha/beta fold hydrolase n=1 Tax=Fulvivirga ligni TaxID=2904246 RepID=UPI001F35C76A|nr:alpha/beta hydrolase [Fulvivirga ligni]UII20904.1 alpha/beta hydrolase [Fulvivirga ligni]